MGFTINFNVGVVQRVVQFQSGWDKDDGDQEKKEDKKPVTVVEDNNGEEKKKEEKKTASTAEDNGEEKKKKEKKTVSTAVFAVHCRRCIRKVCKVLAKTKGIRETVIDVENNHVTVKGEMDMKALADYLGRKLKKAVVIVQVNENGGGADKEEKEGEKNGGATEYGGVCPYGCPYPKGYPYGCPYPKGYPNLRPNGYESGYLAAAEQMFSDENPNACFVM